MLRGCARKILTECRPELHRRGKHHPLRRRIWKAKAGRQIVVIGMDQRLPEDAAFLRRNKLLGGNIEIGTSTVSLANWRREAATDARIERRLGQALILDKQPEYLPGNVNRPWIALTSRVPVAKWRNSQPNLSG